MGNFSKRYIITELDSMAISVLGEKHYFLMNRGYDYILDHDIYCNFDTGKCFSLEFVESNDIKEIRRRVKEKTSRIGTAFTYYFNNKPSHTVATTLEKKLKRIVKKRMVLYNSVYFNEKV